MNEREIRNNFNYYFVTALMFVVVKFVSDLRSYDSLRNISEVFSHEPFSPKDKLGLGSSLLQYR